ncbi:unnamed protein product, partial [marine sediment metagenome]
AGLPGKVMYLDRERITITLGSASPIVQPVPQPGYFDISGGVSKNLFGLSAR